MRFRHRREVRKPDSSYETSTVCGLCALGSRSNASFGTFIRPRVGIEANRDSRAVIDATT